jgi:hypothetical protein
MVHLDFGGLGRRIELVDLNHPSITVALPIVIAMMVSAFAWIRSFTKGMDTLNKRIDDLSLNLSKRIDDLRSDTNARLTAIERRLDKLEEKVEALQERTWR